MAKCASCNYDNPPGRIFCVNCQNKIARVEQTPEPSPGDMQLLQQKIQSLQQDLLGREAEIKRLDDQLQTAMTERDDLASKHPEIESILRQLDEKDRALKSALEQLEALRTRLPAIPPDVADAEPYLLIATYPIADPAMNIKFTRQQDALDLSNTRFHIRAQLERVADTSVQLVIKLGATINVKTAQEKHWRRMEGGTRVAVEAGMVLFDPKGAVNARLDACS